MDLAHLSISFLNNPKYLCIRLFVINEEEATEDNTFANKTFLSIDERFALNATSMLDQSNTSIREDFAASQINLDLLSYQKNPRVMQSTL